MAARSTQNNTTSEQEIISSETENFSVLSPEPVIIIPQAITPVEILGTFLFVARQNKWYADTPSGWSEKFSRWATSG
jgi:hypothetical protein